MDVGPNFQTVDLFQITRHDYPPIAIVPDRVLWYDVNPFFGTTAGRSGRNPVFIPSGALAMLIGTDSQAPSASSHRFHRKLHPYNVFVSDAHFHSSRNAPDMMGGLSLGMTGNFLQVARETQVCVFVETHACRMKNVHVL